MIYCFDLDGTICSIAKIKGEMRYDLAEPFLDVIAKINNLKAKGNKIIISTARGSVTGIDLRRLTLSQLKKWCVKYDELYLGNKIHADIYVDDKAINASAWRLECGEA